MKRLVDISVVGVEDIINDVLEAKNAIDGSDSKICEAVTKEIETEARKNWAKTHLEDVNGIPIVKDVGSVVVTKGNAESTISVSGKDVAFLEFGAGVHHNGTESYPGERPVGIVGIGMYGKGKGKNDAWSFGRPRVRTHGNPAFAPMYHAARSAERKIFKIAQEIIK